MQNSFLPIYERVYAPYMGQRRDTFRNILSYLETKGPFDPDFGFRIVETGCSRNPDILMSMSGDGASSVIWNHFLKHHGKGKLYTVDISSHSTDACLKVTDREFTDVTTGDSVSYLMKLSNQNWTPDFVYLDSYDIDWNNPHPSAMHHIKELIAIRPILKNGSLIVVDDHMHPIGKGMYVYDFFDHIGVKPFFLGYQVGWIWQ